MAYGFGPTSGETMICRELLHRAVPYPAVFSIKSGILSTLIAKAESAIG